MDTVKVVDLRTVTFDVPPQEVLIFEISICFNFYIQILTKDSVTVRVDGVVYFRIFNPTMSVVKVENAYNSTFLLAQTTMRSVLGTKNLAQLLSDRETISSEMGVSMLNGN